MRTKVVNVKHTASWNVYIGRPKSGQPWGFGNPFAIGPDGRREDVIEKYERWILLGETFANADATRERREWIRQHIPELKGKVLACFCKPQACHGDVLARLADGGFDL